MKVLYDFNGFETYVGGVSKCMVELIQHLPQDVEKQIAGDTVKKAVYDSTRESGKNIPRSIAYRNGKKR